MKRILGTVLVLLLVLVVATISYCAFVVWQARDYTSTVILPDVAAGQWRQPDGAAHSFGLTAAALSDRQTEILIKVQDPGFIDHNGMDLFTPGAGLTTITQSVVKKLYFADFQPGLAKIPQSLIAVFALNDMLPKKDQLTLFINMMSFGNMHGRPVVGLKDAAEVYYGKQIGALTEDEYISLIAMIVMPSTFHLVEHPEWNRDRSTRIKALLSGDYIPTGLMDQYYGGLPQEVIDSGLPPASYFKDASAPDAGAAEPAD